MGNIIRVIIFIVISILFAAWAKAMTASGFDSLKFYLIYIPLLIQIYSLTYSSLPINYLNI